MNEDGRFIPPGPGRLAAFARRGGFGTSSLLSAGAGMLSAALVLYLYRHTIYAGITALFQKGLVRAADGALSLSTISALVFEPLRRLTLPVLLAAATGIAVGALLPAWAARRHKGNTAVPLPKMPGARIGILVIRGFGAALFLTIAALIGRNAASSFHPNASSPIAVSGLVLLRLLVAVGAVSLLTGAAERLLLSHRIYHALFLDRSEHRREMRAQQGSRDAAAKRARAQHREIRP